MNSKKLLAIQNSIVKKAKNNNTVNYPIIAIGINKYGDILGTSINKINCLKDESKKGFGKHAERELIKKFGKSIKTIILFRKGKNNSSLPIQPCKTCSKICNKLNIKVLNFNDIIK